MGFESKINIYSSKHGEKLHTRDTKNKGFKVSQIRVQILILSLITCVNLSKLFNFSGLFFLISYYFNSFYGGEIKVKQMGDSTALLEMILLLLLVLLVLLRLWWDRGREILHLHITVSIILQYFPPTEKMADILALPLWLSLHPPATSMAFFSSEICSVILNATATQHTCSLNGVYHPH